MSYHILVINPGSTSTKLAFFEDEKKIFEKSVFHDAPELADFGTINDRLPYRKKLIPELLRENGIDLTAFYPGKFEHEAMAEGTLRVLRGEEKLQIYAP